jgi:hypothetical protein
MGYVKDGQWQSFDIISFLCLHVNRRFFLTFIFVVAP